MEDLFSNDRYRRSVLFVTLDSCRYDTFLAAGAPNMKSVGPLHQAMAPGNFTYSSHAAMFVGFTPGDASKRQPYVNPKYGKIFKMVSGGLAGHGQPFMELDGRNIIDGFNKLGYLTIGTGAAGWFDPQSPTGKNLTADFQRYFYPGNTFSLKQQVDWMLGEIQPSARPIFAFLNVGETHVPYYFTGASWDVNSNPCVPFSDDNQADECRTRQIACVEFIDAVLKPLLDLFQAGTTIICSDHGDCWGEDGLWEHGIHHPKVLEVPLLFRLGDSPGKKGD